MRVVAGELKGRRLASPRRGSGVRPTSDRVREALFSMLGDVSGASVLDLYCGTAALAIEALSRGAARAVAVDDSPALAQSNVQKLGLGQRCRVVRADALAFVRRDAGQYDLILCDPPYRLADRLQEPLESLVSDRLTEGGRLVVESSARAPIELGLETLALRTYGEAQIGIYRGA